MRISRRKIREIILEEIQDSQVLEEKHTKRQWFEVTFSVLGRNGRPKVKTIRRKARNAGEACRKIANDYSEKGTFLSIKSCKAAEEAQSSSNVHKDEKSERPLKEIDSEDVQSSVWLELIESLRAASNAAEKVRREAPGYIRSESTGDGYGDRSDVVGLLANIAKSLGYSDLTEIG